MILEDIDREQAGRLPVLALAAGSAEFEIGARLTFQPYGRAYGVKVTGVYPNRYGDGRCLYGVEGMAAISITSGECLVESKHFRENAK